MERLSNNIHWKKILAIAEGTIVAGFIALAGVRILSLLMPADGYIPQHQDALIVKLSICLVLHVLGSFSGARIASSVANHSVYPGMLVVAISTLGLPASLLIYLLSTELSSTANMLVIITIIFMVVLGLAAGYVASQNKTVARKLAKQYPDKR